MEKEEQLIKLHDAKRKIALSIDRVNNSFDRFIKELVVVQRDRLYLYEGCKSIRDFIVKNNYPERINCHIATIFGKMKVESWRIDNGLSEEEAKSISEKNKGLLASQDVKDRELIERSKNLSQKELEKAIGYERNGKETAGSLEGDDFFSPSNLVFDFHEDLFKRVVVKEKEGEANLFIKRQHLPFLLKQLAEILPSNKLEVI